MDASRLFDVAGKVVLVTGGSRGIGKMIASGYAAAGATVYITSRDAKACEETAGELSRGGRRVEWIAADLQKEEECHRLSKEIGEKEKALHVLVNNAGASWGAALEEFPDHAFTKVLTLNVQRVFTLTQACLPLLKAGARVGPAVSEEATSKNDFDGPWEDPARVIHIGSIDGIRVPELDTFSYSTSKAALHHLSKVLAMKLSAYGITSNVIACGPFESRMMKHTLESFGDVIRNGNPLRRIGTPEDVAGTCLFLSSRAGAYVNGANITLDGGAVLGSRL